MSDMLLRLVALLRAVMQKSPPFDHVKYCRLQPLLHLMVTRCQLCLLLDKVNDSAIELNYSYRYGRL